MLFSYLLPQVSSPVASTSSVTLETPIPSPSSSNSNSNSFNYSNRFPAPNTSHHALLSSSTSDSIHIPTGRKRERSAFNSDNSILQAFDISEASNLETFNNFAGHSGGRMEGYGEDAIQLSAHFEEEANRAVKKRKKGLASTIVDTAVTSIIYGSVLSLSIAYTGYQLWKNPSTFLDGSSPEDELADSPPPYSVRHLLLHFCLSSSFLSFFFIHLHSFPINQLSRHDQTPSQIPRRIRHAHPPRPRPPSRRSSPEISLPPLTTTNYDLHTPRIMPSIPHFLPLERSLSDSRPMRRNAEEEEEEETELDEEMLAMGERMKALIDSGREALNREIPIPRSLASTSQTHSSKSHYRHSIASSSSTARSTPTPSNHDSGSTRSHSALYPSSPRISPTLNIGHSRKESGRNGRLSPVKMDRGFSLGATAECSKPTSPKKRGVSYGGERNGNEVFDDILGRESGKGWWEK